MNRRSFLKLAGIGIAAPAALATVADAQPKRDVVTANGADAARNWDAPAMQSCDMSALDGSTIVGIVGMTTFQGQLFVATSRRVYLLADVESMTWRPLEFR